MMFITFETIFEQIGGGLVTFVILYYGGKGLLHLLVVLSEKMRSEEET